MLTAVLYRCLCHDSVSSCCDFILILRPCVSLHQISCVFPFVSSPVLSSPHSPHLLLIPSLVCLYLIFLHLLVSSCHDVLSIPGFPVLVCRSLCLPFGRFLFATLFFGLCLNFGFLVFDVFCIQLCLNKSCLPCVSVFGSSSSFPPQCLAAFFLYNCAKYITVHFSL